jgi:hypothetical protein
VKARRKIFGELIEGVDAMKKHREGKLTLRSYKVEAVPLPAVNSKFINAIGVPARQIGEQNES